MVRRKSQRRSRRMRGLKTGIAWYDTAQWDKLKQVADDPTELDDSHGSWQRGAERLERELSRRGLSTCRVPIDVDALVAWCRKRNKPVNATSRAEYTTEVLRTMVPS